MKSRFTSKARVYFGLLVSFLAYGCTDPVTPEFNYVTGLIYIDALLTTVEGASYVTVSESAREFGINKTIFIEGASVSYVNVTDGTIVNLAEEGDTYLPPSGFKAEVGELWELNVLLTDGRQYRSLPEKVSESVPIQELDVEFDPELYFDADFEKFVPAHIISVTLNDPPSERNYYYWRYRTYERLINCKTCFASVFREGECMKVQPALEALLKPYYTYACETFCWQIRYGDEIKIFTDDFTDGKTISKLPVANILLYNKKNVLVELQQFSLSPSAYEYYKKLKDLIDDNSEF